MEQNNEGKNVQILSANSTKKYVDVLDEMVNDYNNTKHSSIKMTPDNASDKKNESVVWVNLYSKHPQKYGKPIFEVGDKVRITKKKVQYTDPPTYKITDYNDEEIQGTFYEQELQKTSQEVYRIEKVIRKRGDKSLVKWLGYPESFNSWVDNKNLIDL